MHLVIGTREDPPLPLARLRARGNASPSTDQILVVMSAYRFVMLVAIMIALIGMVISLNRIAGVA